MGNLWQGAAGTACYRLEISYSHLGICVTDGSHLKKDVGAIGLIKLLSAYYN